MPVSIGPEEASIQADNGDNKLCNLMGSFPTSTNIINHFQEQEEGKSAMTHETVKAQLRFLTKII